jgi:hypothetical protein
MKLIMFPVALFCFFILLVQPASAQDTFAYKGEYFGNDGYKITVLGKNRIDIRGTGGGIVPILLIFKCDMKGNKITVEAERLGKGVGRFVKNGQEIQWRSGKVLYQKR